MSHSTASFPDGDTINIPSIGQAEVLDYLSGVERSERNISIDNIARIARGLKVKAWMLLDDSVK